MCWSIERSHALSALIESNGLDHEIATADLARALWVSRQLMYKWCTLHVKHGRIQVGNNKVLVVVRLGDFKDFVDSRIGDAGVKRGRYKKYADCRVVVKFANDRLYILVNPGDYFHHMWNGYPPQEGDVVMVQRIVTNVTAPAIIGREVNGKYTAFFAAADLRELSKGTGDNVKSI